MCYPPHPLSRNVSIDLSDSRDQGDSIAVERPTNWIDWTKALSMLFIIWGHLSPDKLNDFVYSFSVPSFFLISGYLFKTCTFHDFWKKNIRSLIVPYSLLGLTLIAFFAIVKAYFGGLEISFFPWSALAFALGDQNGIETGIGCQALWFVYTLMLIKIIANTIKSIFKIHAAVSVIFLSIAAILHNIHIELFSSYANVLVSYPFFAIGYYLKTKHRRSIESMSQSLQASRFSPRSLVLVLFAIVAIYFIGYHNGMVKMYNANYGNNLILFVVGGLLGSFLLAYVCMNIGNVDYKNIIKYCSNGSMLVLGWQIVFLIAIGLTIPHIPVIEKFVHNDLVTFLMAVLIYLIFIPIIIYVTKKCPILIGYRKI